MKVQSNSIIKTIIRLPFIDCTKVIFWSVAVTEDPDRRTVFIASFLLVQAKCSVEMHHRLCKMLPHLTEAVHTGAHSCIIPLRICQNCINAVQIHIRTNVTPSSTLVKELDNRCCKIYCAWELTAVFLDSQVFLFTDWIMRQVVAEVIVVRQIQRQAGTLQAEIFILLLNFSLTPKKRHWQRHRHLSVSISLSVSVSLKPCSPQLRWLASLFPFFFFSLSPSLECQPQASQSQQKSLQAKAAMGLARSPHMVSLSEPHIYNLDKEMTDLGSGFWWRVALLRNIVVLYTHPQCWIVRQTPTECVSAHNLFIFFNSVIFLFFS